MGKDVIVACDFASAEQTFNFLDKFTGKKPFVKIGMELYYAEGPSIVREIKARGHKIFLYLTQPDIPHPVKTAIASKKLVVKMSGQAPGRVDRRNYSDFEAWGHEERHPYLFNEEGARTGKPRVLYGEDIDNRGMFFEGRLEVRVANPKSLPNLGDQLRIRGEKEILLIFSAATSYNGPFRSPSTDGVDAAKKVNETLKAVRTKSYEQLLAAHEADYKSHFALGNTVGRGAIVISTPYLHCKGLALFGG